MRGGQDRPPTEAARAADLDALAARVRAARCAVALTGAGMSTESGLPDYRGVGGLWRNRRFEELASIAAFRREPAEFWAFYRERLAALAGARPNAGHRALAALERAGLLRRVITQNVDGLHRGAGSEPLEVHGSLAAAECLGCRRRVPAAEAERRSAAAPDGIPRCDAPEHGAGAPPLKPAVVLFGEMLPPAMDEALELLAGCDLLLVLGSSLAVHPVAGVAAMVHERGGAVAIVNRGETGADALAAVRIDAPLGETLTALVARLGVAVDGAGDVATA